MVRLIILYRAWLRPLNSKAPARLQILTATEYRALYPITFIDQQFVYNSLYSVSDSFSKTFPPAILINNLYPRVLLTFLTSQIARARSFPQVFFSLQTFSTKFLSLFASFSSSSRSFILFLLSSG